MWIQKIRRLKMQFQFLGDGVFTIPLWREPICHRHVGGHKEMSSILADQKRPSPNAGGGGGVAGPQPMSTAVHMEPK